MAPDPQQAERAAAAAPYQRTGGDGKAVPFAGPQPFGMAPDLVLPGALDLDGAEELWIPQSDRVSFRPLLFNTAAGSYVNLLRVRGAGILSRHRHFGAVHAFVLRGSWLYLEHDWMACAGDFVFEPPGETHTLVVPENVPEMVTLFHVSGGYSYVTPDGEVVGYEDVFTKLDLARTHYRNRNLPEADLLAMIR